MHTQAVEGKVKACVVSNSTVDEFTDECLFQMVKESRTSHMSQQSRKATCLEVLQHCRDENKMNGSASRTRSSSRLSRAGRA